jgi:Cu(I)/Ag(I) efflux system protein CusF
MNGHRNGTIVRLSLAAISLAAGVALPSPGLAQDDHAHGAAMPAAAAPSAPAPSATAPSAMTNAQVIKIDQAGGNITLKHGPIKKLGMDRGMTMVFKAQDPAMLKTVKAGDKVKFDADDVNGQYIVTKIEKAK